MKSAHQLALWSGVCALLGNLVGLKLLEIVSAEDWLQLSIGLLFSILVGMLAYAKERLNEVKREAEREERRHDLGPSVERAIQDDGVAGDVIDRHLDYSDDPQVPGRGSPRRY